MPLYEYECPQCTTIFELTQSIKDEVGADCPKCGGHTTHRLIGSTNFVLKGSCWAKDRYSTQLRHELANLPQADESDDE